MKKWIIAIFIILLSVFLLLVFGRDEQDLGDNYYYLPEYEAIDVGYPGGAIVYKSSQKYLYSDIKIKGDVISVNSNKDFVIAIQKIDSSNMEKTHSVIVDLQFYIIVKSSDLVYGPYSKKEYLQKRKELGVPNKLRLKE